MISLIYCKIHCPYHPNLIYILRFDLGIFYLDRNIKIYVKHNEGKSVAAEQYIRTLENKIKLKRISKRIQQSYSQTNHNEAC